MIRLLGVLEFIWKNSRVLCAEKVSAPGVLCAEKVSARGVLCAEKVSAPGALRVGVTPGAPREVQYRRQNPPLCTTTLCILYSYIKR